MNSNLNSNTTLNILLIDDDELDRQTVLRALRQSQLNCRTVQAATAAEGLALASQQQFDAVLLDYRLPDQDGIDVLIALRSGTYQEVAVVMLSRQEDETIAERCFEAGAQDFLLKDEVNGRRLLRSVRQARQRYLIESELRTSREQLRLLSEHDPLTGLSNRRGFELVLQPALSRAKRSKDKLALLLLDLDDFKSINDTLGHDAGDQLLVEIAARLRKVVRDTDYLCRLGGDEFVVLMTRLERDEQAVYLANRIIETLQNPIQLGATERVITTSIGIATLGENAGNEVDLLKCADVALYQAKEDGRNQSRFFSADLQEAVQFQQKMKHDLRKALERHEFRVFYQAQINAHDGSLGGVEALLRWQHPTLGLLAPAKFLAIAEESGLIVEIGNWVLHESCRQLKDWQQRMPDICPRMAVAVNLSAVQIRQNTLPSVIRNTLDALDLDGSCLELEITESVLIDDTPATAAMLDSIAAQGITLSMDDFGTGYSSMNHLNQFPISVLKIDREYIWAIGCNNKTERLLVALVAFAKALDLKVVAEGVETQAQADFCTRLGCDLLQGYYYSQPVAADKFEIEFLSSTAVELLAVI